MTSYLVTIVTDHHQTFLKMRAGINELLQKTSGADVLCLGVTTTPAPVYVRGLKGIFHNKNQ